MWANKYKLIKFLKYLIISKMYSKFIKLSDMHRNIINKLRINLIKLKIKVIIFKY